jgi:hypothetical protein
MTEPPSLGRLVGALSAHADVAAMTEVLTTTLADLLPADIVDVERGRTVGDRLAGRPGRAVAVTIRAGERALSLRSTGPGRTDATITHTVRGVVLSRRSVPITEWVEALAGELARIAERDDAARAVLDRLLLG